MNYRHVTPPTVIEVNDYDAMQCPGGSASSKGTYYPNDWSPAATAMTAATTPPKSPQPYPYMDPTYGSQLLPRVRPHDQYLDPIATKYAYLRHSRTISLPGNANQMQFGGVLPSKPSAQRRSISPYRDEYMVPAPYEYMSVPTHIVSPRPSSSGTSSSSASNPPPPPLHTRNISSTGIGASTLSRYGYPTYRQSPAPQTINTRIVTPDSANAVNHLTPISMSRNNVQAPPLSRRRTVSPSAKPSRQSVEPETPDSRETSTLLQYLTSPNPMPRLAHRAVESNKSLNTHFWFDVRNLRSWSDFTVDTIAGIPGLLSLLKIDLPASALPTPSRVPLNPETPGQLADLCTRHHAVKVNAALRVAQGSKHMAMRALSSAPGARQQPEFVANYHSDDEKTIFGDGRGRVVGIVKSATDFHSSMRRGGPNDQVRYLRALAHLHRFMREHGTRYGFVLTDVELVCVRAGGPPSYAADYFSSSPSSYDVGHEPGEAPVPLFGFLEVAASVPVVAAGPGPGPDGRPTMTVGLALWFLHMLAKEQPLPGQFHWRLEVGGPAAMTRRRHEARDDWMPKPNVSEKREAKRVRGWVWPDEPLSKRECGRGKRRPA